MRKAMWLAVLLLVVAPGCGDQFAQGDRVILVTKPGEAVPDKVTLRTENRVVSEATELVPVATRAVVLSDDSADTSGARQVQVRLSEGPLKDLTGSVRRDNLRADD